MHADSNAYGTEKISRLLLKVAPPVMLAQLIQALYNLVDSLFVGEYSAEGLTALSIIYPIQLLMIAFAVGTGVGVNTSMAYYLGINKKDKADEIGGIATPLALFLWIIFAVVCWFILPAYAEISTTSKVVVKQVVTYGRIVCVAAVGLFLESSWTKILQANGDMKTPMFAQIVGAVVNIILDPILIFGLFGMKPLGIAGAAIATVIGQIIAAVIVMKKGIRKSPSLDKYLPGIKRIYKLGFPNIVMQMAFTLYIFGLNLILVQFSDQAVTTLGLYYKWQMFFFIPLGALETCIVPIVSYNYAARNIKRCREVLSISVIWGITLMLIGVLCFELIPKQMLSVFTDDALVLEIGNVAFRIIGLSFIPLVTSMIFPVFFQATGYAVRSSLLTIVRTVVLFVPLGYIFAKFGLNFFWCTFPVTEILTTLMGIIFYRQFLKKENSK